MRKTLAEAVSLKARRPIQRWLDNANQVLATGQNEGDEAIAAKWKPELEEALEEMKGPFGPLG